MDRIAVSQSGQLWFSLADRPNLRLVSKFISNTAVSIQQALLTTMTTSRPRIIAPFNDTIRGFSKFAFTGLANKDMTYRINLIYHH